jgi:hypothetical protein
LHAALLSGLTHQKDVRQMKPFYILSQNIQRLYDYRPKFCRIYHFFPDQAIQTSGAAGSAQADMAGWSPVPFLCHPPDGIALQVDK